MTDDRIDQRPHVGVMMTGDDDPKGPKAFCILIEALPGREEEVVRMLRDIRAFVEDEPATGPWYAVRHSPTRFAIFEVFPDIASRDAHVAGKGRGRQTARRGYSDLERRSRAWAADRQRD